MFDADAWPALLGPLFTAYAPVLAAPGPNLLVVLRASVAGSGRGPVVAALGVACGAGLAAAIAGSASRCCRPAGSSPASAPPCSRS